MADEPAELDPWSLEPSCRHLSGTKVSIDFMGYTETKLLLLVSLRDLRPLKTLTSNPHRSSTVWNTALPPAAVSPHLQNSVRLTFAFPAAFKRSTIFLMPAGVSPILATRHCPDR